MIQIKASELKPGFIVCRYSAGKYLKIQSVTHGANIMVKYDNGMLECFNPDKLLNVRK